MVQIGAGSMSRATVYNTLETLCKAGLARQMPTASGTCRYDADTAGHVHVQMIETSEIRDVPVPADELEGAKRTLVASFVMGLENPASVLARWMQQREYGLPADYWDTYSAKVMAITAADVQRAARKYVPYDNVQIIAVGDGDKIRESLKKFGPVVETTVDGN